MINLNIDSYLQPRARPHRTESTRDIIDAGHDYFDKDEHLIEPSKSGIIRISDTFEANL